MRWRPECESWGYLVQSWVSWRLHTSQPISRISLYFPKIEPMACMDQPSSWSRTSLSAFHISVSNESACFRRLIMLTPSTFFVDTSPHHHPLHHDHILVDQFPTRSGSSIHIHNVGIPRSTSCRIFGRFPVFHPSKFRCEPRTCCVCEWLMDGGGRVPRPWALAFPPILHPSMLSIYWLVEVVCSSSPPQCLLQVCLSLYRLPSIRLPGWGFSHRFRTRAWRSDVTFPTLFNI